MASSTPSAIPLNCQVGGHSGVLTTEDGSLLIKPALPLELQFYQSLLPDDGCALLRPFVPKFYGTLKLEGQLDVSQKTEQGTPTDTAITAIDEHVTPGAKDECLMHDHRSRHAYLTFPTQSLVLENISHPFLKPNILDIKLGTVLYDESAPPDKVARMIQVAQTTTSLETGVRLTGFQVFSSQLSVYMGG
jgi:1D-myo-inositol-tetrakisphosphate 5-kinase/inositol-polyphosphate multikinase